MIVFDLSCAQGHRFEGWFGSSDDFASQQARGLLSCPQCGSAEVAKAPMAPAVPRKGNQLADPARVAMPAGGTGLSNGPMPPEVQQALAKLAEAQARALKDSRWVGKTFADDARAMHYGERDPEAIHGEASLEEARKLVEEGIEVAPLPFPVAPPKAIN
jgi:hypothetical protein